MTETEFDFSPLTVAKLSQGDFAAMIGVSRVTVNLWCNGRPPSKFLVEKIQKTLDAVRKASDAGKLPIKHRRGLTREQRIAALTDAIGSI